MFPLQVENKEKKLLMKNVIAEEGRRFSIPKCEIAGDKKYLSCSRSGQEVVQKSLVVKF